MVLPTDSANLNLADKLCLGIDPHATRLPFADALEVHSQFLRTLTAPFPVLKTNLGFFLREGSAGIALLEKFVEEFSGQHKIILDGKFGEIGNTMRAYLDFAFNTLKVDGVTINPFLGEHTLELAFEKCAHYKSESGRVYVLCATSESGTAELSFIPENHEKIVSACVTARDRVFGLSAGTSRIAGVVVGANKRPVLLSSQLQNSKLSILAPGLGAQGASFEILNAIAGKIENEFLFPISRGIFAGGSDTVSDIKERYQAVQKIFSGLGN